MANSYPWPETLSYNGKVYRISHGFDIPYLAGSSKDRKTIFFDRNWNPLTEIKGEPFDRLYAVLIHEVEEKIAEDAGKSYLFAHHHYAEPAEKHFVESQGIKWQDYQDSFKGEILKCSREKNPNMPSNLEMKPYKGTRFARQHH